MSLPAAGALHQQDASQSCMRQAVLQIQHEALQEKRRREAEIDDKMELCLKPGDEILQSRRMLQEISDWVAVPHTCPMLHWRIDAQRASNFMIVEQHNSLESLSKLWQQRHEVVKAEDDLPQTGTTASNPTQCWKHQFCLCTGEGRISSRMWTQFRTALRRRFPDKATAQLLTSGSLCLLFRGFAINGAGAMVLQQHSLAHVAYALLRPWVPVLSMMVSPRGDDEEARLLTTTMPLADMLPRVSVKAELQDADTFVFCRPWELLSQFNADLSWHVTLLTLSESLAPLAVDWHCARLEFLAEAPIPFWEGRERESGP